MKRILAMLLGALLLACPALAEEADLQTQANAAYAEVLAGGQAVRAISDAEMPAGDAPAYTLQQTPVRFTVLDMNGDGVSDMVLELPQPEELVILFWSEGKVLALEAPYRGLLSLKDDGSHTFSSGATDGGVGTIGIDWVEGVPVWNRFVQASVQPVEGADGETLRIEVDGAPADEAAYQAFLAEHEAKLDALWYDYTEENVKLLLGQ